MSSLTAETRCPYRSRPVGDAETAGSTTPVVRGRVLLALGLAVSLSALVVFVALGAAQMVHATADPVPQTPQRVIAGYGASLWPLGFTVHWTDGSSETRLWW